MKKLIFISTTFLLLFSFSQINAQTTPTTINGKERTKTVQLKITGMTCAGCSSHITQTLEAIKGVSNVNLKYPGDIAVINYNKKETNSTALIKAIEEIKYKAEVVKDKKETSSKNKS